MLTSAVVRLTDGRITGGSSSTDLHNIIIGYTSTTSCITNGAKQYARTLPK